MQEFVYTRKTAAHTNSHSGLGQPPTELQQKDVGNISARTGMSGFEVR